MGKDCGHTVPCGCEDKGLLTPPPCGDGVECPDSNQCSETFDAGCIFYTGDPLFCGQQEVVATNTSLADAVAAVINYFCTQDGVDADIICGEDTVVPEGTSVSVALELIVAYFCQRIGSLETIVGQNTTALLNATQVGTTCVANPTTGCDDCTTTITFRDNGNNIIDTVQFSYTQCPGPAVTKQVISGITPAAIGLSVNVPHGLGTDDLIINVYTDLGGTLNKVGDTTVSVDNITAASIDLRSNLSFVVGTTLKVVLIG